MSQPSVEVDNEFGLISGSAQPGTALPPVRRSWVNVPTGGHVSGVIWGTGPPQVVLLHDAGRSARAWDGVALTLGRPAAAIDLPGHGRSNWRRDGRYQPHRLAPAVAEAIRSFAPQASLVAGTGLGGQVALALAGRRGTTPPAQIALVTPLDWPGAATADGGAGPHRFADPDDAVERLRSQYPDWPEDALRQEVRHELVREADGSWEWRHHIGNLPDPTDVREDGDAFWAQLAPVTSPVAVITGAEAGPQAQRRLAALKERAVDLQVFAIPGAAGDLAVSYPAEVAARLRRLLPSWAEEEDPA